MPSTRSAEPVALAVCDCTKALDPHEHGSRGMYNYHRCRCTPCGDANRAYNRDNNRYRKRREMVDAALVRARVAKLRTAGLTVAEIADLSGVHSKVIDFAVHGRNGKLPQKVSASTFRALNAISFSDISALERSGGRRVDGTVPRLQIQSLHSFGWCGNDIAQRAGITASTISYLLAGNGTTEAARAAIDALFKELHGTDAPSDTPTQRMRATVARNRALANGWTADTATDHEYARYSRAH